MLYAACAACILIEGGIDGNKSVTAVFDSSLAAEAIVGIHPNDTTASIWLAFQDVVQIVKEHGNEIVMLAFQE